MIDWERYYDASKYIMDSARENDTSLYDIEDAISDSTPAEASALYEQLKEIKETLEDTLELVYIDMQIVNKFHKIEPTTPIPTRRQNWVLDEYGNWRTLDDSGDTHE